MDPMVATTTDVSALRWAPMTTTSVPIAGDGRAVKLPASRHRLLRLEWPHGDAL